MLANLSIAHFGPSASIINAFLFIGLDLTSRDKLHDAWNGRGLWAKMAALIMCGSLLSWMINRASGQIALASCIAFFASGLVDAVIYHAMRDKVKFVKINGSNIASAAVDSIVFPALAFGFPLLGWVIAGQFIAKTVGGFIWSLILRGEK